MRSLRLLLAALSTGLVAAALTVPPAADAGEVGVRLAGTTATLKVASLAEIRFQTVIRQEHDFSCGAAALATLLTYHYDTDIGEAELVEAMLAIGNPEEIRTKGFSMGDMQRFLASHGVRANGYWADLDAVAEAGVPVIALINVKGYRHFVVVKGIRANEVLVGDPALGLKIYRKADFEAFREGPLFAIDDHVEIGRRHFNRTEDWGYRPKVAQAAAQARTGRAHLLTLRPPGEF